MLRALSRVVLLASMAVVVAASSCKKVVPPPPVDAAAIADTPVPAPAELLAEGWMTSPNATWAKVQRALGGVVAILPSSFGGVTCSLSGLDVGVAPEVDGVAPVLLALGEDAGEVAYVLGMRLVDPRHVRATLLEADTAKYVGKERDGLLVIEAKGGAQLRAAVALAPNGLLLVARNDGDLRRLGPYVWRTLPKKAVPSEALVVDVPTAALAGPLGAKLGAAWTAYQQSLLAEHERMRKEHGGREADFADPPAIVALLDGLVQKRLALLPSLLRVRLVADVGEEALRADVTLTPQATGPAQEALATMRTGDAAALLSFPAETGAALLAWQEPSGASAASFEEVLARVLGTRLAEGDRKKLGAVAGSFAKARGDWLAAGVVVGPEPGIVARMRVADAAEASHAVGDALGLAAVPAFREPLRSLLSVQDVRVSAVSVPELGQAQLATFARSAAPQGGPHAGPRRAPKPVALAWMGADGELRLALSHAPATLLGALVKPKTLLGADPRVAAALSVLGADASLAVVVQGERLDLAPPSRGAAPVVLGWGRRNGAAWLHADVAVGVLRDGIRRASGL